MMELEIESFSKEVATWAFAHAETLVQTLAQGPGPILVDLDGTLSDPTHRRHYLLSKPPDWVGFSLAARHDRANLAVISWLRHNYMGHPIVITSGRPAYAMVLTKLWLAEHRVRWDVIALRPLGDTVRGVNHKMRIVATLKDLGLTPECALDDSEEVSLAYSAIGIRCFRTIQELRMAAHLGAREGERH